MSHETAPTQVTEAVAELIGLAAAMAANSEEAFEHHNARLDELGVSRQDRIRVVNIALQVKMAPHRNLVEMAEASLVGGGCCGGGGECECKGEGEGDEAACCGDEGCGCK